MTLSRPQDGGLRSRVSLPLEIVMEVRRRYARGDIVSDLRKELLLSSTTFYRCLDRARDAEGNLLPKIPRRRSGVRRQRKLTGNRTTLIARLWRTAEGQVSEIEDRLARHEQQPGERERDARVITLMSRAVKDLSSAGAALRNATHDDDDTVPRDLDELRRVVSRRLDDLVAEAKAVHPDESETP